MTKLSQTYGVKSNATRALRKLGITGIVEKVKGGWAFHIPVKAAAKSAPAPAAKAKPAQAKPAKAPEPRRYPTFAAADKAAFAAARRAGLHAGDFVVVVLDARPGESKPAFGFLGKHHAASYRPATPETILTATVTAQKAKAETPARQRTAKTRGRAAGGNGGAKEATVLAMMRDAKGAAMPDICKATDWLPHTARARISGIAKRHKKELKIERQRIMGVSFYYAKPPAAA